MRLDPRPLGWGVFLIVAGAVPLAVRAGLLDADVVVGWWRLWPFGLIALGVGVLLGRTSLQLLGGLIPAALFGLLVGGLLATGANGFGAIGCGSSDAARTPFPSSGGTLSAGGSVDATLDCGSLTLRTGTDESWRVEGSSNDGLGPLVDGSGDRLSVRSRRSESGPDIGPDAIRAMDLRVTAPSSARRYGITVNAGSATAILGGSAQAVSATVNAGSLDVDLAAAPVTSLDATVNAGSGVFRLPNATLSGSLTVNAGSITICAPSSVALRLQTRRGALGGNDYGSRGLRQDGDAWVSPDWATATNRITLETTANAGSFSLNPEAGCR